MDAPNDASDIAFDIIGTRRGVVGGVTGIPDWDVSRMRETREIVLFDFGGRPQGFDGVVGFQRAQGMLLSDVDKHLNPGCTVILGDGIAPPSNAAYPIKIRVLAPHGFTHDNIRTFELCVELVEDGLWGERPPCRMPRKPSEPPASTEDEEPDAREGQERQARLGASPRLEPEQGRSYTKPMFQVEVEGFVRNLRPGYKGRDKDNNPVDGWTWVNGHPRYTKLPPKPGQLDAAEPSA